MKKSIQIAVFILGLISLGLGIKTMLQTPTLILPAPFLVLMYTPILVLVSFGLGFAIKKGANSEWHTLTFTSIIVSILCLIYYVLDHRPGYTISIPDNYEGKVYLLESDRNDFEINIHGIGYISTETLNKGFMPTIYKGNENITDQINGYAAGMSSLNSLGGNHSIDYVAFEIPGKKKKGKSWKLVSIDNLIEQGAIDTTRIIIE